MGFIIFIIFAIILIYGFSQGSTPTNSGGVRTYRRKARTLSSRR